MYWRLNASTEKEERLDNVANGTAEDGWISPNRQSGSPRCSHSRQSSNASSSSMQYKRWVDVITGNCIFQSSFNIFKIQSIFIFHIKHCHFNLIPFFYFIYTKHFSKKRDCRFFLFRKLFSIKRVSHVTCVNRDMHNLYAIVYIISRLKNIKHLQLKWNMNVRKHCLRHTIINVTLFSPVNDGIRDAVHIRYW